jgi:predicted  nucleic acid-binding Zn-ribbon protein
MNEGKIENMLSQLIRMVGNIQSEQQEMKQVQQDMQGKLQNMENKLQDMDNKIKDMDIKLQEIDSKLQGLEAKGEERHQEVIDRFKALEIDQNFIWEKTVRNEREIANIKGQLS